MPQVAAEATGHFFLNHTQHMGRGMRGCPGAYWNDGLFDVIAPQQLPRAELLRVFKGVQEGGWHKHITPYLQGREALFEFPTDEGVINLDGEVVRFEGGQVKVECVRDVVRLFAPQC